MNKKVIKPLLIVGGLVALSLAALFHLTGPAQVGASPQKPQTTPQMQKGLVSFSGGLVQGGILQGGEGLVSLDLTLTAAELPADLNQPRQNVDLVIVLDRSGSMEGPKIMDAKAAVLKLLESFTAQDRFALVTYSDGVIRHSGLKNADADSVAALRRIVSQVQAGGGTNLGAGLDEGIRIIKNSPRVGNNSRIILISDGLANQGVTDPAQLSRLAAQAGPVEFTVSTVGVGQDFNEYLMTALADHGLGTYYYLENPNAFAKIFQKELHQARITAAKALEISVPLPVGASVVDAAGYPVEVKGQTAIFRPGDLLAGQTRKLYVTLRFPTDKEQTFNLSGIGLTWLADGQNQTMTLPDSLQVACVKDEASVLGSIDRESWEKKVLQEDYNKLKEEVARDIKNGDQQAARQKIDGYYQAQQSINSAVGSAAVTENLENDLDDLRGQVDESFSGEPEEALMKQKGFSKKLQHEGYQGRRSK